MVSLSAKLSITSMVSTGKSSCTSRRGRVLVMSVMIVFPSIRVMLKKGRDVRHVGTGARRLPTGLRSPIEQPGKVGHRQIGSLSAALLLLNTGGRLRVEAKRLLDKPLCRLQGFSQANIQPRPRHQPAASAQANPGQKGVAGQ